VKGGKLTQIKREDGDNMSGATITKFPVTAPDGTEYRVKIEESENFFGDLYVRTTLYYPRRWFGYRELYSVSYRNGGAVYNAGNPDYVAISHEAVADYYARIESDAINLRKHAESILRKQAALDRFAEWDGKITEVAE
jgi:hypothetical protein